MVAPFVNLRVHSSYSLLESTLRLDTIINHALQDRSPAIALSDTSNLFGALEFSQKSSKKGIQPIIALQLPLVFKDEVINSTGGKDTAFQESNLFSIILLAGTEAGYSNMMRIISSAYLETPPDQPVHYSDHALFDHVEGILCLTGGPRGPIGIALKERNSNRAEKRLLALRTLFGNRLYVELERLGGYDRCVEEETLHLAYRYSLPLVAVNEAFFETPEDFEAHDALLAVAEGSVLAVDERRRVSRDHYLKSSSEMALLFEDLPEALSNTIEIARRCSYYPQNREVILPRFFSNSSDTDKSIVAEDDELSRQAYEGLEKRLSVRGPAQGYCIDQYYERLKYELSIIQKMRYSGYFLIVSDFIKWAKSHNIAVGPGRGSGAGSLVAYATTITDVDPLRFSLIFERFLNPDRISMPDFDIDFCQDRRGEVISYVQKKYGIGHVGQIITFGTLQARAVLRDVGRVLQMPYSQVDRLCKLIPYNPAHPISLEKALEIEPRFLQEAKKEPIVETLLSIARKLEGLYRHVSTHAAGIVIADRPLSELVPIYRDSRSEMPVTQFNMKKIEDAGLIKFDFLGLKTLTVLQKTVELLAARNVYVCLENLPLDDKKTYELLSDGNVFGIFQIESAGMRKALIGMKPDRIEDIIALVSLYRPGPMENIPTYNARKNKQENIASIHPKIDPLLSETQGVIVYQEQVMQIAQELAGYSLSEADLLRRAMGKKIRSEMDSQRKRFISGALERGLDTAQAHLIFDLLAKFADYGFNKSHAAAYAIISYQTAYLKAHFPVEFIAASMTMDISNTNRLADFRRDALRLGIEVVSPSVSFSFTDFHPDRGKIYYALSALKGIGHAASQFIVEKRQEVPFKNLADFCQRMDPSLVGKRVFESLIMAGALDCFGYSRARMMAGVDKMLGLASRVHNNKISGQRDIFNVLSEDDLPALDFPAVGDWSVAEQLRYEFQIVGFYLSAHPLDEYTDFLKKIRVQSYTEFLLAVKHGANIARLAGTVVLKQEKKTKTGGKIGIVTFSDCSGQYEAVLFSEILAKYGDLLQPGVSVLITVLSENRLEEVSLRIQNVETLEDALNCSVGSLRIHLNDTQSLALLSENLSLGGTGRISFIIKDHNKREVEISLQDRYKIDFSIISALRAVPGVSEIEIT